ncbi:MAG: helix-turn-helix transcriptional regulator [bacterium]|nr:helix-turn-helix transcriptional regulator [bacterium]
MKNHETLMLTAINPFTPRQQDVLRCILSGLNPRKIIAQRLNISPETVDNHLYGIDIDGCYPGIFGTVERITGHRPATVANLIYILYGDVVINSGSLLHFSDEDEPTQ